jgi:hypothetical protein
MLHILTPFILSAVQGVAIFVLRDILQKDGAAVGGEGGGPATLMSIEMEILSHVLHNLKVPSPSPDSRTRSP